MPTYSKAISQKVIFAVAETTFGADNGDDTTDPFVAADAIRVTKAVANRKVIRDKRDDANRSRTVEEQVEQKIEASYEIEGYLTAGATDTTAPDWAVFLESVMGTQTTTTDIQWTLATDLTQSFNFLIPDKTDLNFNKIAVGCIPEDFEVTSDGAGLVKFKISGPCKDVYMATRITVPGGALESDTTLTVNNAYGISPNSILAVGSLGGERIKVTSVSVGSATMVVDRGYGSVATAAIASAATLIPWHPSTETLSTTSPLSGINGAYTASGVSMNVTGWTWKIKNNLELTDDLYGTDVLQGFIAGALRECSLELNFYAERDELKNNLGLGYHQYNRLHSVTLGPNTEFQFDCTGEADMPEIDGDGTGKIPYTVNVMGVSGTDNSEAKVTHSF